MENVSKQRKKMAAAFVGAVQPMVAQFPASMPEETPTAEDFFWALMLIYSRGYWLDADDNVPAIVPLADMMNHDTSDHGLVVSTSLALPYLFSKKKALISLSLLQEISVLSLCTLVLAAGDRWLECESSKEVSWR